MILGGGTLTFFADTSPLMGKQKVAPIAGSDEAESQIEVWAVYFTVPPRHLRDVPPLGGDIQGQPEAMGASLPKNHLPLRPYFPHIAGVQWELPPGVREAAAGEVKNFKSLQRALATRNFRPELVTLRGGLAPPDRTHPPPAAPRRQALATSPLAVGNPLTPQTQVCRRNHETEQNPHPAPQMQICQGLWIRTAIDKAVANGVDIPLTDDGCYFCLSYHLKGVCNTYFGGQHSRRPL